MHSPPYRFGLLVSVLGGLAAGCADDPETRADAQLIVFAIVDPELDATTSRPASVLFTSTVAGQAWVHRQSDGTTLVERERVLGGALHVFQMVASDLEPGINYLSLSVAADAAVQLRHDFTLLVDAMCTREEHCLPLHCVGYECME